MTQSLTIEEIAEIAQVSRSTVSRVLNEHPNVRASVRSRVLRVIQEHNYAPRAAARSLANNRNQSICFLFPNSEPSNYQDPFFGFIIQGIIQAASQRGYFVMASMLSNSLESEFYAKVLRSRPFDGLILLTGVVDDTLLPNLLRDRIPFVLCEKHPYLQQISWVEIDNRASAREAVLHLLALGHRRIATIAGPQNLSSGMDRRDGYKQALFEYGIVVNPDLIIEGAYSRETGYNAMQKLLALPEPPTAVFAASDGMAMGAIQAIRESGRSVPNDIAVVGFDDLPVATYSHMPLTTVHQPISEIGYNAAEILIDQLESKDFTPVQRRMPTQLIIRDSCGAHLQGAKSKGAREQTKGLTR